jgi:hypothetical protein
MWRSSAYSVMLKLGESFDETNIQLETIFTMCMGIATVVHKVRRSKSNG